MLIKINLLAVIPNIDRYTAYFFQKEELIILPIEINENFADSLLRAGHKTESIRPSVYDTIKRIVSSLEGKIDSVAIYLFKNDIYYSYISLERKRERIEIDCGLRDALCLALYTNTDIYIEKKILKECGIKITKSLLERSLIAA
jgi:bifunctional DNase/RNase